MLAAGMERGELRPMAPGLAAWLLLGMMYPFFYAAHAGEMPASDDVVSNMLTIFFDGALA